MHAARMKLQHYDLHYCPQKKLCIIDVLLLTLLSFSQVKDTYDVNNLNCSNHDEFKSLLLKLELRDIIIKSFGPVFGSGVITNETPLSTYWRSHAQNATDNQEFKMNVEKYLFRSRCVNHTCDLYSS